MDLEPADLVAVSKENTLALSMSRLAAGGFLPRGTLAEVSLTVGATIVRRDLQSGEREIVREVRAPDPAGVTRFDSWTARDGEAYAYQLDRLLTNLFLVENLD
jgi:hypothetical protein